MENEPQFLQTDSILSYFLVSSQFHRLWCRTVRREKYYCDHLSCRVHYYKTHKVQTNLMVVIAARADVRCVQSWHLVSQSVWSVMEREEFPMLTAAESWSTNSGFCHTRNWKMRLEEKNYKYICCRSAVCVMKVKVLWCNYGNHKARACNVWLLKLNKVVWNCVSIFNRSGN